MPRPPGSTLSLHDALPISRARPARRAARPRVPVCSWPQPTERRRAATPAGYDPTMTHEPADPAERGRDLDDATRTARSEEHTSELQSHVNLVCRLLLEKKK